MKKPLLMTGLFTLLLAWGWHSLMPNFYDTPPKLVQQLDENDSYMTHATLKHFDQNGYLSQQLTAKRITHTPKQNQYDYDHPVIAWMPYPNSLWQLQARRGTSMEGLDRITLSENVRLHHERCNDAPTTTATTTTLTVHNVQQTLDTDQPVRIEQPGIVLSGTGLHGDLHTGKLNMLANINTTLIPLIERNTKPRLEVDHPSHPR